MSQWYKIKDEDDVDLSDDKKFVQILFDTDQFGNCYVEVPVEMLVKLLEQLDLLPCGHTKRWKRWSLSEGVQYCALCKRG